LAAALGVLIPTTSGTEIAVPVHAADVEIPPPIVVTVVHDVEGVAPSAANPTPGYM
jgi:hypothetical protein